MINNGVLLQASKLLARSEKQTVTSLQLSL